ncbi:MAG: dockerin type I repeat-containing protein, partial [Oscillospiraceae bacterium]|nr:dockerin type I repeat-containing protein [Oscillospiraceae bacterium]
PTETEILYGDTDCNGKVELLDIILLNKNLLGMEKLSERGAVNADVDRNKSIDSNDALYILKSTVSLVTLPV